MSTGPFQDRAALEELGHEVADPGNLAVPIRETVELAASLFGKRIS